MSRPTRREVGTVAFLLSRTGGDPHPLPLLGSELDLLALYIERQERTIEALKAAGGALEEQAAYSLFGQHNELHNACTHWNQTVDKETQ